MTVDEKTIGETDIKDGDFLVVTVTIAKVLINLFWKLRKINNNLFKMFQRLKKNQLNCLKFR